MKRELEQLQKRLRGLEDACKASSCVDYIFWNHHKLGGERDRYSEEMSISLISVANCEMDQTCLRAITVVKDGNVKLAAEIAWEILIGNVLKYWNISYKEDK